MLILWAALGGFLLDLLLGDPPWLPHPVVGMGRFIARYERQVRPRFPASAGGQFWCGVLLSAALPLLTLALSGIVCLLAYRLHPWAFWAVETLGCWQSLAVRGLATESRNVYRTLQTGDLPAAQKAVGRIVGRETARLDAAGVIRAAVESVAENFSDGVAAPMLYFFLGGAPLALTYKSINTCDSCVGYKSEPYLYFGRAAAKLDDAANFLPARAAALFLVLAAAVTGEDARGAFRIWRRDRQKHASPNAGEPEAACAGALGLQLGGPAWYFGTYVEKPFLGDALHEAEPGDILRANRMLYVGSFLLFAACAAVRWAVCAGR